MELTSLNNVALVVDIYVYFMQKLAFFFNNINNK